MRTLTLWTLAVLLLATAGVASAANPAAPALDEQTILDSLKGFDRPLYDELMRLRDHGGADDPQYRTRLQKARGRVQLALDHPDWAAADGKLAEVEAEVDRQAALYLAAATDAERQALYGSLGQLAAQAHDLRVDSFRYRIAVLEMRLAEMEQTVHAREQDRDRFIQEYLDRKLGK